PLGSCFAGAFYVLDFTFAACIEPSDDLSPIKFPAGHDCHNHDCDNYDCDNHDYYGHDHPSDRLRRSQIPGSRDCGYIQHRISASHRARYQRNRRDSSDCYERPTQRRSTIQLSPAGQCGTFSPNPIASAVPTTYQAPPTIPAGGNVTVTATSVTDPTNSVSATITIE